MKHANIVTGIVSSITTVAIMSAIGFGPRHSIPDVVEARAFHVVGKDGTVLVKIEDTLGTGRGLGGTVTTLNGSGRKLVMLTGSPGGGAVTTMNGKGRDLVSLTATTNGAGMVTTSNRKGKELVSLGAHTNGAGTVTTSNGKGKELVWLSADADGNGAVAINDRRGQNIIGLSVNPFGPGGVVSVFDPKGIWKMGTLTTHRR